MVVVLKREKCEIKGKDLTFTREGVERACFLMLKMSREK